MRLLLLQLLLLNIITGPQPQVRQPSRAAPALPILPCNSWQACLRQLTTLWLLQLLLAMVAVMPLLALSVSNVRLHLCRRLACCCCTLSGGTLTPLSLLIALESLLVLFACIALLLM
jgi:hypothetical protein